MSDKPHPLDIALGIEEFGDNYDEAVEIPDEAEDRNLDLVIELALKQYKMNADDMSMMESRVRIKTLEINRDLLNTVKDARYKKESLQLQREKLEKMGTKSKPASQTPNESGEEESSGGVSRRELAEKMRLQAVK